MSTATGRGHNASVAATIAAASSSVGTGRTFSTGLEVDPAAALSRSTRWSVRDAPSVGGIHSAAVLTGTNRGAHTLMTTESLTLSCHVCLRPSHSIQRYPR